MSYNTIKWGCQNMISRIAEERETANISNKGLKLNWEPEHIKIVISMRNFLDTLFWPAVFPFLLLTLFCIFFHHIHIILTVIIIVITKIIYFPCNEKSAYNTEEYSLVLQIKFGSFHD